MMVWKTVEMWDECAKTRDHMDLKSSYKVPYKFQHVVPFL